MKSGLSVLPAWSNPISSGQYWLATDTCDSLPSCVGSGCTSSVPGSAAGIARPGSSTSNESLDQLIQGVSTELEDTLMSVCEEMQQSFCRDMRKRLKALHSELQQYTADQQVELVEPKLTQDTVLRQSTPSTTNGAGSFETRLCSDCPQGTGAAACDQMGPRPSNPRKKLAKMCSEWNFHKERTPVVLPTVDLQVACLEHDMHQGRLQAQEAILAAGFLGGTGRTMQVLCVIWGCVCLGWPFATDDTGPWHIGDCGAACSVLRFVMKIRSVLLGIPCLARAYFLHRQQYARAHWAFFISASLLIASDLVLCLGTLYLVWEEGCSWQSDSSSYLAAGETCASITVVYLSFRMIPLLPLIGMWWALWHMNMKEATQQLLCFIAFFLCHLCVSAGSTIFYLGDLERAGGAFLQACLALSCAGIVLLRRFTERRKAWKLVARDAEAYEDLWNEILTNHAESVQALSDFSKSVMADIDAAAEEGPQRYLSDAENQRRLLLRYHRDKPGALLQTFSSLHYLYAQAWALDEHFQNKCAVWADGLAKHKVGLIKHPSRAVQKVWRSYCGNPQALVDLVRSSIVCDTPEHILQVLQRVKQDKTVRIVRIKNRFDLSFDSRKSGGFRNLSVNLIICDPDTVAACTERHICELQLGLQEMTLRRTDGGHRRYVSFRDGRAE
eukprot:TRINITY_DN8252_c0_g1_i1.p1 TRINITY_DN8252_c0_g1~~TRINITY_DN8252_c0_g1_i1.p1  ORF type:complete len:670 (+),score=63.40 TRINITY_DN8252_c0_g1_i1:148-2157(+)